jgi:putative salt-induced outer membrane protein YdiY
MWAALVCLVTSLPLSADQITMKNGDRLTGSILKSDGKNLTMKSEFAGPVTIPWDAVEAISSSGPLNLQLTDGQTIVGIVTTADGNIEIQTKDVGKVSSAKSAVQTIRSPKEEARHQAEIERLRNPRLLDLWNGFLDTGLATTRGNSKTSALNLGVNAARTTQRDKIGVYFTSLRASNSTTGTSLTTANAIRGGINYNLNISEKAFAFGFTDLEFDEFQKLDLRFVTGGGLGYHAIKTSKTLFDLFAGPSLNKEFFSTGLRRTSGEILFGEELVHKISSMTSLRERLVIYPNVSDFGSYRINFDTSAVTTLSRWLAWHVTVSDRFLSNPVPGAQKNDVLFTTGLRVTFAGE